MASSNTKRNVQVNNNKTNNNVALQPFCKVCQDSGKPENVFKSHFTRETPDPNSRVVCPTLLSMECRFCYKSGHTVKYCKLAKNANNVRLQAPRTKIQAPPVQAQTIKNSFAAAFGSDDDDDSDEENDLETEEFPELCCANANTNVNTKTTPLSFARIIPGTFDQLMAEKENKQKMAKEKRDEKEMRAAVNVIQTQATTTPFKRSIFPMKSWADDSDFEDEEDIPRKEQTSFKPVECNDEW
jgi:hypothetical protein